MKRGASLGRKPPKHAIPWRDAEYVALRANAADTSDDRINENIFDAEDERAEVDLIVRAMIHGEN